MRATFREIGTMLCGGTTVDQVNQFWLLPNMCLKVSAEGWMTVSAMSESLAENTFVASGLCYGLWTREEINRDFLNPSGEQLTLDAEGRLIIESLPDAPD